MKRYPTVLTIAGSDSGGGAGIQADLKAASACGAFAMSVITSLTAQNTRGVQGIHLVPAAFVRMQAEAVLSDIGADALKLGMLPTPEIVDVVEEMILKYAIKNVVLDPVMIATSGDRLISQEAIERIVDRLLPLVRVVTPNIPEAEFITGITLKDTAEVSYRKLAEAFWERGTKAVLLKSGHVEEERVTDYLFEHSGEIYPYPYTKINTPNTHGTGCTLSSAIAAYLAQGEGLSEAVGCAESYIHQAVSSGAAYQTGEGHGPVDHFFRLRR